MKALIALSALLVMSLPAEAETGWASYYGKAHAWKRMASGYRFDPEGMTCAHKTLPFGTKLLVTNLRNGFQTRCTVQDRGPFVRGRIIDLSVFSARAIGMIGSGTARVRLLRQ